jgi:hypothetical protein
MRLQEQTPKRHCKCKRDQTTFSKYDTSHSRLDSRHNFVGEEGGYIWPFSEHETFTMIGKNRQLVTDEPVEFEE